MRYLLTGDEFDAQTALRLGFIQEIVEPGRQIERAVELATHVADQSPLALAATIENARVAQREGPAAAAAQFGATQTRLLASADFQEGMRSFKEKRPPRFHGK
jgi:enoyl-CoA hydratase/carnithine racemase